MVEPALIILAALCIKHFFADFMLQFPYMIEQKGTYGAEGGIHHATIHAAFTFMILSFTMHPFMMISLARDAPAAIIPPRTSGAICFSECPIKGLSPISQNFIEHQGQVRAKDRALTEALPTFLVHIQLTQIARQPAAEEQPASQTQSDNDEK